MYFYKRQPTDAGTMQSNAGKTEVGVSIAVRWVHVKAVQEEGGSMLPCKPGTYEDKGTFNACRITFQVAPGTMHGAGGHVGCLAASALPASESL